MSRCLITGCRLVLLAEGKSLWGDLHEIEDNLFRKIYVLGGNTLRDDLISRSAAWEYAYPHAGYEERQLLVRGGADYLERRGIVTVSAIDCEFNDCAKKYLGDR